VLVELALMLCIIFTPGLSVIFQANSHEPFKFMAMSLISATALIAWGEIRKYFIRMYPTSEFAHRFGF
jgi:hypothetical protein